MEAKYLRQIDPSDTRRDPTMTHVADLTAIRPGDILHDWNGMRRVVRLRTRVFGNEHLRIADLAPIGNRVVRGGTRVHDLRDQDMVTATMNVLRYTVK